MNRVVIESPFSPANGRSSEENAAYARRCMLDSLKRGEAPFASHLLYTQILDDTKPEDRELGIRAGFAYGETAMMVAVYIDYGFSKGMAAGVKHYTSKGAVVVVRTLDRSVTEHDMKMVHDAYR